MSWIVVDVESDNPTPATGSMICFGAVLVSDMSKTFYGETAPLTDRYDPDTLAVSGIKREQHELFQDSYYTMNNFRNWIVEVAKPPYIFVSDNPAYDWQWINYYFDMHGIKNPFGFSARRIGDLWCGMQKDTFSKWKHLRITEHTHDPVMDAKGDAEVCNIMKDMGLKVKF